MAARRRAAQLAAAEVARAQATAAQSVRLAVAMHPNSTVRRLLTRARPSRARRPAPRGRGQRSRPQPRGLKEETPAKKTARCNDEPHAGLHRAARLVSQAIHTARVYRCTAVSPASGGRLTRARRGAGVPAGASLPPQPRAPVRAACARGRGPWRPRCWAGRARRCAARSRARPSAACLSSSRLPSETQSRRVKRQARLVQRTARES